MIRRVFVGVLLPVALLVPAAAVAATSSGSKSDPRGDGPGHGDVLRVSASYKSGTGRVDAKVSLASYADAAAHRVVVGVYFATVRRGRCSPREGAALVLETDTKVAHVGLLPDHGKPPMPANVSVAGDTISMSARKSQLARKPYNCVIMATLEPTGPTTSKLLDTLTFRLRSKRAAGRPSRARA